MRVLLVSTHVDQTTGYSKVAHNLIQQIATLQPAVKLFHYGFQRHPGRANLRKVPKGVVSYDASAMEDPREEGFGYKQLREYIDTVMPSLVIFYNDPLVVSRFLEISEYKKTDPFKVWVYIDMLYMGIAQQIMDKIDSSAERVYTFTERWKSVYKSYFPGGCEAVVNVLGHAADPDFFKPIPNKKGLRADVGIPDNAIVFLNCNRNTERKRLDLTIAGFVGLLARDTSKPYYLILATGLDPRTSPFYDPRRIFMSEAMLLNLDISEISDRIIMMDTGGQMIFNDEAINRLYNAADFGVNTSDGEGFGLCQLEHLQTGAPQLVTSVGSYEFLEGCAVVIPASQRLYHSQGMPLGLFGQVTTAEAVTQGMLDIIQYRDQLVDVISKKVFPSWAGVCEDLLEDILTMSTETK
jgi:glycosyltransferase involved in cell wall biosynthesis